MVSPREPTVTLSERGPLFAAQAALAARLELAFPSRQFTHLVLPAALTKPVWDRLVSRLPVVGRSWVGLEPERQAGRRWRGLAHWKVLIACRHAKPEQLLLGSPGFPGALGFAGTAVALLHGWTARDVGMWTVGSVGNAYSDEWVHDDVAAVLLDVSVGIEVVDEAAGAALPDFLADGGVWSLPDLDTAEAA